MIDRWCHSQDSDRKLRLFACACCRRLWHLLTDERARHVVEIAERFADGQANEWELMGAETAARLAAGDSIFSPPDIYVWHNPTTAKADEVAAFAASLTAYHHQRPGGRTAALATSKSAALAAYMETRPADAPPLPWYGDFDKQSGWIAERKCQEVLFADIFDAPTVALDPNWLTTSVKGISQTIYQDHRFVDMPILGDALEDAGCTESSILSHLRSAGPHVRGCWAVDLVRSVD